MTPQSILLSASDHMHFGNPHKVHYQKVLCKIMDGTAPDSDDISVIVQGISMCGYMCTLDMQDAVDWINQRFGTEFSITVR